MEWSKIYTVFVLHYCFEKHGPRGTQSNAKITEFMATFGLFLNIKEHTQKYVPSQLNHIYIYLYNTISAVSARQDWNVWFLEIGSVVGDCYIKYRH